MNTIQPIDIRKLLIELKSQPGMTDAVIGEAIDAPQATVTRLRNGKHKTTDSDRAIRIHNFHAKIFAQNQ